MGKSDPTLISIGGGGEIAAVPEVLDEITQAAKRDPDARMLVMTVATNEPEDAAQKYDRIFRNAGFKHGSIAFHENFLNASNRHIDLRGRKAEAHDGGRSDEVYKKGTAGQTVGPARPD
ncbi:MAG: hypothetical protein ACK4S4_05980 [Pyrinomonadaceae bacterium]